jgi:hypothetical protein
MKAAVRAGLRPAASMNLFSLLLGMPQADSDAGWVQMVMNDTTEWALCPSCVARVEQYLRK